MTQSLQSARLEQLDVELGSLMTDPGGRRLAYIIIFELGRLHEPGVGSPLAGVLAQRLIQIDHGAYARMIAEQLDEVAKARARQADERKADNDSAGTES